MKNTEEYATHAANTMVAELFEPAGFDTNQWSGEPLSEKLKASRGYPTQKALRKDGKAIGQCLPSQTSAGGETNIFLSPVLGLGSPLRGPNGEHDGEDSVFVLACLAHEVAHAANGNGLGGPHGSAFAAICDAIGLEGPATETRPGPKFKVWAESYIKRFGSYNFHAITVETLPSASTKLLKVVCINPDCPTQPKGYPTRATWKWIYEFGCDFCACCRERKGVYLPRLKGKPGGKGAGDQDPGAQPVAIGPGGDGLPDEYTKPDVDFVTDPDEGKDGEGKDGEPGDGEPSDEETDATGKGGEEKAKSPSKKSKREGGSAKTDDAAGSGKHKAVLESHPVDLDCDCPNCTAARKLAGLGV